MLHTCLSLSSWFTGAVVPRGSRAPSCEARAGLAVTHSTDQQALASSELTMQHPHPCPCPTVPHPRQTLLLSPELAERNSIKPGDSRLLVEKSSLQLFKTKQPGQWLSPEATVL